MENKKTRSFNSLTHAVQYRTFDVNIVGLQMPEGWHMSVEINKWGKPPLAFWRDRDHVYPDFNGVRAAGLLWSKDFIDKSLH